MFAHQEYTVDLTLWQDREDFLDLLKVLIEIDGYDEDVARSLSLHLGHEINVDHVDELWFSWTKYDKRVFKEMLRLASLKEYPMTTLHLDSGYDDHRLNVTRYIFLLQ